MHTRSAAPTQHNMLRTAGPLALAGLASALLAGCGGAGLTGASGGGTTAVQAKPVITGKVHGGQYAIAGATMQIYSVATGTPGTASIALIGSTVKTDASGNFSIPASAFNCSQATQIYLTSVGGDSTGGGDANPANENPNISMAAALGSCTTVLNNPTQVTINEETTIAAAFALAPFATDLTHIASATANSAGIVNAFATSSELVNIATGAPGGNTNGTPPLVAMNTLANIIASCINTAGSSAQNCTDLQTATGASDTFDQALAIAKNPGSSTFTALYVKSSPTSPFQTAYASQPNDFSLGIKYAAPSAPMSTPYAIALDASGNAWVTNESGTTVTELSPAGLVLASPTATNLFGAQGVAIDRTGNVWVANTAGNSVVEFTLNTQGAITGTNSYTSNVDAPSAVALDSHGNAWVTNFNGNSVTEISSAGAVSGPFTGSSNITVPSAIALDTAGKVYVASGTGTVVQLDNSGNYVSSISDSALQNPVGLAVDASGHIFAAGNTTGNTVVGAVGEYTTAGVINPASPAQSGVGMPLGVASDGTSAWIANSTSSGSLVQLKYGNASASSPSAGFLVNNATSDTPVGVAVDASGNVWVTNSNENTVTKYVGIAVPVTTPIAANVGP